MQVTSAYSCRTREIEDVGTVELVYVARLLRMGDESFLLPVRCGDLLEVGLLAEGSWIGGQSGQLPKRQETFMGAEWATSHSQYHAYCSPLNPRVQGEHLTIQLSWIAP